MPFNPANAIQDQLVFGEFGGVNPSVTDSVTYTFMTPDTMEDAFEVEMEGCFLYSRHWNPMNKYLSRALADMEGTESAQVTASGMSAIGCAILQLCQAGDEIISSPTVYGGTYALYNNVLPKLGIKTHFVNPGDHKAIEAKITDKTRVIYTESVSNPLLQVADIPKLAELAHRHGIILIVDNTFTPMILSPAKLGADVVIYSLTKFINGTADTVAGSICGTKDFIDRLTSVNDGACMLLGPVLDSARAASILKNMHTLHIRMQRHSRNAQAVAEQLSGWGCKVHYPGLTAHPEHALHAELMNPGFGFGGMLTLNVETHQNVKKLMATMQKNLVGYLAVSLGYFKTLFSAPGSSTSSEIPAAEQQAMGLTNGLVRFSIGLDDDIERTIGRLKKSLEECELL